jgi:hypothetical protein
MLEKVIVSLEPVPEAVAMDSKLLGLKAALPASIERYLGNPCNTDEVFTLDTAIIRKSLSRKL